MSIAVLGTGPLARRIAAAAIEAGRSVALFGDPNAVVDAIEHLDAGDSADGTTDLDAAVDGADVVVDTREHDDAQRALATVEESAADDATLVVVSEGSITAAAAGCRDPGRVMGLTELDAADAIELVATDHTDPDVQETTQALFEEFGVVVPVQDVPGRVGHRLELALEHEAMLALEDGVATPADIDRAMETAYGHGEGPLATADRVGLDDRLETLESLADYLGSRFEPPAILRERVESGATGRSAGQGFYAYEDGERVELAPGDESP
ncbi:3-hydroxyacyl-CoA dehydrogenase family protein [Halococcoides cellulosivorans]|uniref:3-hydroxyacyl-CoA dehydrogenase n=1 Tax=Halococcoides cellulosivorans TaxID=1679096 RepID=A0A2R4X2T4_9EURY|nr:3-hydroxyacyl-CoA dehydrogenase family protein [Halococcoides cellulosivorans]AWB28084.1 3-hydroxyacyl-CoA dehydrogenase [Halococcoides cellulosivorans]